MNGIPSGSTEPVVTVTPTRRVSWGAIWAGMFVTIIMEFMFILLGVAVGIKTLNPGANAVTGQSGLSFGAMIWLMCSWLVAIWVGARVAGWMCGGPRRTDGMVHGMVVWSFAAAVILLLLTGAVGIGGAGGGTGGLGSMSYNNNNNMAMNQQQSGALTPTGRTPGEQSNPNANAGNANAGNAGHQPNWGKALWTFIALALGLAVASEGGAEGASALYRTRRETTVAA